MKHSPVPKPALYLPDDQKRVIWQLRTGGAAPRSTLATSLGLHIGAMTRISRELMTLGLVRETNDSVAIPRGRPVLPLEIDPTGCYAAGATVHPGWLEIVLVDFAGRLITRHTEKFDDPEPEAFARLIRKRLPEIETPLDLRRSRFLGIGVATTGPTVKAAPGHRLTTQWMAGWRDVDLPKVFSDTLGEDVWVENECSLAALAEYYDCELREGIESALVVFIGQGMGGGIVINRKLFSGDFGNAGEIGMMYPAKTPRPSGVDLLSALRESGVEIGSLIEIEDLMEMHADTVDQWCARVAPLLSTTINFGVSWLDPASVVISGALPLKIFDKLRSSVASLGAVQHPACDNYALRVSRIGSAAPAIGAALLPIHAITES